VSDIRRFVESVSSRARPIKPSRDGSVRELEGATARPTLPECLKQNDVHTVNIIAYIKTTQYGNHHAARIIKAPIPAQPPSLVFYSCPSNSISPQPSPRLSQDYEQHRKLLSNARLNILLVVWAPSPVHSVASIHMPPPNERP
jgi:hypothetical protein